jgi:hypothetical protein
VVNPECAKRLPMVTPRPEIPRCIARFEDQGVNKSGPSLAGFVVINDRDRDLRINGVMKNLQVTLSRRLADRDSVGMALGTSPPNFAEYLINITSTRVGRVSSQILEAGYQR